jgi:hypothetical protein
MLQALLSTLVCLKKIGLALLRMVCQAKIKPISGCIALQIQMY